MKWTVAQDQRSLLRDGISKFLLADTVWSAFRDASLAEWRRYVRVRAAQGYTHLLISVLPILQDTLSSTPVAEPFAIDSAGHYDYGDLNEGYFDRAALMLEVAMEEGVKASLVLLWCCYIPESWGSRGAPWRVMPREAVSGYVDMVIHKLGEFDPIYVISGDDDLASVHNLEMYDSIITQILESAPEAMISFHTRPATMLPFSLQSDVRPAFYAYQAGHGLDTLERSQESAAHYLHLPLQKPVMNLEPCYEGHGKWGGAGRWTAREVRHATWASVLAGASAGVGYGAHGLWQWWSEGNGWAGDAAARQPFPWDSALHFRGGSDVALAAQLIDTYGLAGATPVSDLISETDAEASAAYAESGYVAVYLPHSTSVRICTTFGNPVVWNLESRSAGVPRLKYEGKGVTVIQPEWNGDSILIGRREG